MQGSSLSRGSGGAAHDDRMRGRGGGGRGLGGGGLAALARVLAEGGGYSSSRGISIRKGAGGWGEGS